MLILHALPLCPNQTRARGPSLFPSNQKRGIRLENLHPPSGIQELGQQVSLSENDYEDDVVCDLVPLRRIYDFWLSPAPLGVNWMTASTAWYLRTSCYQDMALKISDRPSGLPCRLEGCVLRLRCLDTLRLERRTDEPLKTSAHYEYNKAHEPPHGACALSHQLGVVLFEA